MTTNDNVTTVGAFTASATALLVKADISTARLDVLILMEDTLGQNRANILAHPELVITASQQSELKRLIEKRRQHIPLAYLRGKSMFYGHCIHVTFDTLIPRPETEDAITLLKKYLRRSTHALIADVGTGSGCLGLTAALELPDITVDLYDISGKALEVARENAQQLGISPAHYFREDLLTKASQRKYDAIIANLPYVPDSFEINRDATFEPRLALFAGSDGLDKYRILWQQLENFKSRPRYIITESLPGAQHEILTDLSNRVGYELEETCGFIQLFSSI